MLQSAVLRVVKKIRSKHTVPFDNWIKERLSLHCHVLLSSTSAFEKQAYHLREFLVMVD